MYTFRERPDAINKLNWYIDKYYAPKIRYENNDISDGPDIQFNVMPYNTVNEMRISDLEFLSRYYYDNNKQWEEDNNIIYIEYQYEKNLITDKLNILFFLKYMDGITKTIDYHLNEYNECNLKIVEIFDDMIEALLNYFERKYEKDFEKEKINNV